MSTSPAITTAFLQHAEGALSEVIEVLRRAQVTGIAIDSTICDREHLEALHALLEKYREELPVVAIESGAGAGRERAAELASVERDEAHVAIGVARAAMRRAEMLGARFVVLQLGRVQSLEDRWTTARDLFVRGSFTVDDVLQSGRERDDRAERHFDAARQAVDVLLREAEDLGVTLCVANRRRYIELPSAREMDLLLSEFRGAPLAPLFDVARAHMLDSVGHEPLDVTLAAFGAGPLAYVGDACGHIGALARGHGIVELSRVDAAVNKSVKAFSPWPGLTVDEALKHLAGATE